MGKKNIHFLIGICLWQPSRAKVFYMKVPVDGYLEAIEVLEALRLRYSYRIDQHKTNYWFEVSNPEDLAPLYITSGGNLTTQYGT